MGGYIGSSVGNVANVAERKQTYSITTATTSLTGLAYTPTKVHVFHNGVRLVDSTDYTATNGTSITLTNAAQNGDEVVVISYPSFQVSDTVSAANGGTFAGNIAMSGNATVGGTLGSTGLITASAGVAIGGTGAANTLDDYEEGTWTPTFKSEDDNNLTVGYNSTYTKAVYTKIGNRVFCQCQIDVDSLSGEDSDNLVIAGLPFTSGNYVNIGNGGGTFVYNSGWDNTPDTVLVLNVDTQARIMKSNATTSSPTSDLTSSTYSTSVFNYEVQ